MPRKAFIFVAVLLLLSHEPLGALTETVEKVHQVVPRNQDLSKAELKPPKALTGSPKQTSFWPKSVGIINSSRSTKDTMQAPASKNLTLFQQSHELNSSNWQKGAVPIQAIPGTNLFTGVYYNIRNIKLNQSRLTWVERWDGAPRLCVLDPSGSYNSDRDPHDHNAQWMFAPSGVEGWYRWFNRGLTVKNDRFSPMYQPLGRVVVIVKLDSLNEGWHAGFWKPQKARHGYFITNRKYEFLDYNSSTRFSGPLYLTTTKTRKNLYRDETKYEFLLAQEVKLQAWIRNFEYPDTPESILEKHTAGSDDSVFKQTISNNSSAKTNFKVEQSFIRKSTFTWGLDQSLNVFAKMKTTVGLPHIASAEIEGGLDFKLGAHQTWSDETTKQIKIAHEVVVIPYSFVEAAIYITYYEGLSLPFTAEMDITGTLEGNALSDDGGAVNNGEASGEHILQAMKANGSNIEVLSVEDNTVRCRITGVLTGTFGYRGIFSLKDISTRVRRNISGQKFN